MLQYSKTIGKKEFTEMVDAKKKISYCNIINVKITARQLVGIEISNCYFENVEIANVDLQGVQITDSRFYLVRFKNCKFDKTVFSSLTFWAVSFDYCKFTRSNITRINAIEEIGFTKCKFNSVSFKESKLYTVYFTMCKLYQCNFHGADLTYTHFLGTSITQGNFTNACVSKIGDSPIQFIELPLGYHGCNLVYNVTNDIVYVQESWDTDKMLSLSQFKKYTAKFYKPYKDGSYSIRYYKYLIAIQLFELGC